MQHARSLLAFNAYIIISYQINSPVLLGLREVGMLKFKCFILTFERVYKAVR